MLFIIFISLIYSVWAHEGDLQQQVVELTDGKTVDWVNHERISLDAIMDDYQRQPRSQDQTTDAAKLLKVEPRRVYRESIFLERPTR
jgi:hypothetical protein